MAPLTPWWPKLELKIWPHLAESIESEIMDGFWCSRCLNDLIDLPNIIGSFASNATASIVAKNWTKNISQPFKELHGSDSEFKLITPKSITGTISELFWDHFGTILGPLWEGPLREPFGTTMEPLWDHFGPILGPLWDHFLTTLGPFWDHFGTIWGPLWDHVGTISGQFWDHYEDYFGTILGPFLYWPFATKEGAEGPQKGPKGPPALRRS